VRRRSLTLFEVKRHVPKVKGYIDIYVARTTWRPKHKRLAVSRETKLTLRIALNLKSKLTLESGTNPTNRNARACLSIHYRHPQQGETPVISRMLFLRHTLLWSEIVGGYNTPDTMVEIGA